MHVLIVNVRLGEEALIQDIFLHEEAIKRY
jgi:hypothetical protein